MQKRIRCPYCGYSMPILYSEKASSSGIVAKCKGRNCGKEFEIKVRKGEQIK